MNIQMNNLNDYMLDGLIDDALWGDLTARDKLNLECQIYKKRRKELPKKIVSCLRELTNRKRGRSRRNVFLDHLTYSYITFLKHEGYKWDVIAKKYAARFGIFISRKSLEKIYYNHVRLYAQYKCSF